MRANGTAGSVTCMRLTSPVSINTRFMAHLARGAAPPRAATALPAPCGLEYSGDVPGQARPAPPGRAPGPRGGCDEYSHDRHPGSPGDLAADLAREVRPRRPQDAAVRPGH